MYVLLFCFSLHAGSGVIAWMAAYVNRTISMMSGDGVNIRPPLINPDPRLTNSPLQIFVKAKRRINDIFVEIEDYVQDAVTYMKSKYISSFSKTINLSEKLAFLVYW